MLESSYPYTFLQKCKVGNNGLLYVLLYHFKSTKSNLRYIVRVEEYEYKIYAIKFYLKSNSNSKNKYSMMTNTNEPRRIIYTCINIMLSIYESNKSASFGFIGANGNDEDVCCTKRYRVYSRIIATYFSDIYFVHKENIEKSAYMLINRKELENDPNLISQIENFFITQYEYFE
jgi:hypothetical protein